MGEFSVRKLASAMGVGPTSIHAHFKGGTEAISSAVAAQALAGTTRPFKPMEEPAEYLRELLLKMLEALHARPIVASLVVLQPLLKSDLGSPSRRTIALDTNRAWRPEQTRFRRCSSGRWASYSR